MSADQANKVVQLAPYRAARTVQQRPALPYVLWYPHIGFVKPVASVATLGSQRVARGPR